jgi:hypothetical protein
LLLHRLRRARRPEVGDTAFARPGVPTQGSRVTLTDVRPLTTISIPF